MTFLCSATTTTITSATTTTSPTSPPCEKPTHFGSNDKLPELQCCIKPEPVSQTRLPYCTSPSLDIQSPSRQHEDAVENAVETVKVGLKRLHAGDVQVCNLFICSRAQGLYTSTGVP
jgi:hypothetical protein